MRRADRTLADVGEFGLIDRVERWLERAGGARSAFNRHIRVGIGDDAAVVGLRRGEELAVSCDAFVEKVHFRWDTRSAPSIGRCALASSLSDLAAMGARPLGFTCAFAAPPTLLLARFDGVIRGLAEGAIRWQSPLIGGNVTRGRETSLALTVLGALPAGRALVRSDLRAADRLFVTGTLGGAALGVATAKPGAIARRTPEPRLVAGQALARMPRRGACIDISDGFVADLRHLLESSDDVGAEIDVARLPRPRGFGAACARAGLDADQLVLGGGEDYELLFSLRPGSQSPELLSRRMGVVVTEVGRVTRRAGIRGLGRSASSGGWKHF